MATVLRAVGTGTGSRLVGLSAATAVTIELMEGSQRLVTPSHDSQLTRPTGQCGCRVTNTSTGSQLTRPTGQCGCRVRVAVSLLQARSHSSRASASGQMAGAIAATCNTSTGSQLTRPSHGPVWLQGSGGRQPAAGQIAQLTG